MAGDLDEFWVHTVTVTPERDTPYGAVAGEPVEVPGFLDNTTRLVRSPTGDQVASTATFYCDLAWTDTFIPGSAVTLPTRDAEVIGVQPHDAGGLDLPEHLEVQFA